MSLRGVLLIGIDAPDGAYYSFIGNSFFRVAINAKSPSEDGQSLKTTRLEDVKTFYPSLVSKQIVFI
ncbi:MAG: hypothetical protein IKV27_07615, partial [Lachnospiraceae bacterium]|nr:hypothetical protein [Lachnospiraceae bacterium]